MEFNVWNVWNTLDNICGEEVVVKFTRPTSEWKPPAPPSRAYHNFDAFFRY